jgi:hypothetical protein
MKKKLLVAAVLVVVIAGLAATVGHNDPNFGCKHCDNQVS